MNTKPKKELIKYFTQCAILSAGIVIRGGYVQSMERDEPSMSAKSEKKTPEQIVNSLKEGIKKIDDQLETDVGRLPNGSYRQVIIALGITGSGKSTLINFLAGKNLKAKLHEGDNIIEVENPLPGIVPKAGGRSETSVPAFWYDNDTIYYDCPGLGDTRGDEQDLLNIYAINKLFQTFQNVDIKFLIPMNETDLRTRALTCQDFFKNIAEAFKSNIDTVGRACCFILSQQERYNLDNVKSKLNSLSDNFSDTSDPELYQKTKNLMRIISNHGKIAFFPYPKELGPYLVPGTDDRKNVYGDIIKAITETGSTKNISPTLTPSPDSKVFAINAALSINNEINKIIIPEIVKGIYDYCRTKIVEEGARDNLNLLNLRQYFIDLSQDFHNIHLDLFNLQEKLRFILNKCGMNDHYKKFETHLGYIKFFEKHYAETPTLWDAWGQQLKDARNPIEKLGAEPKISPVADSNRLRIEGFLVSTSDIVRALDGRNQPTLVHLHGLNSLFIDQDIISNGTFARPGISFSFIAPNWYVIGHRTINLNGVDGDNGAQGEIGQPGQPGRAGGNGGHFYGKGHSFFGMDDITISTNGGKGGNGGNGGQGVEGASGEDGDITKLTSTDDWSHGNGWGKTLNRKYHYYNDDGKKGQPGGKGFDGGASGNGGLAGRNDITGYPAWDPQIKDGNSGNPGTGGAGGIGGKHGRNSIGKIFEQGDPAWYTPIIQPSLGAFHGRNKKNGGVGESGGNSQDIEEPLTTIAPSLEQLDAEYNKSLKGNEQHVFRGKFS